MKWLCSLGFEGLLTIGVELILVDSVKVLAKKFYSPTVVADQDLKSGDLVEVERTVIAEIEKRNGINKERRLTLNQRRYKLCSSSALSP